ncbi:MAG: class I SAM-dependent methyltransferase [Spirochaetaceae bacterium]|nr:MAG: class I SAM-dependent methyltransferase [Spirochaetaceae bacterium]
MPWVEDDRLYPEEIDPENEFQNAILKVFVQRYEVAVSWLYGRFGGRPVRILDMACGSGYGSKLLSAMGEVVAVDIEPRAVEYAQEMYGGDGLTFRVGSADDPSFLNSLGSFDAIVSIATIEHIDDVVGFLCWMQRSLRPNGVCALGFPASLTLDWASPHHKRDISPRQARRLFAEAGLRIQDEFHQRELIGLKDLLAGQNTDQKLPAQPLRRWLAHYLLHPHHFAQRAFEFVFRGGLVFAHQEYQLTRQ